MMLVIIFRFIYTTYFFTYFVQLWCNCGVTCIPSMCTYQTNKAEFDSVSNLTLKTKRN